MFDLARKGFDPRCFDVSFLSLQWHNSTDLLSTIIKTWTKTGELGQIINQSNISKKHDSRPYSHILISNGASSYIYKKGKVPGIVVDIKIYYLRFCRCGYAIELFLIMQSSFIEN